MSQSPIIIEPKSTAKTAVIWLHGLGADGHDFVNIIPELKLPIDHEIRFIFPHAPLRPITINNGYVMRGWYDIFALDRLHHEDEAGIKQSQKLIEQLIEEQHLSGIAYENIYLVGFSQGGAMALHTGLRFKQKLAGIVALSCYLPLATTVAAEKSSANQNISIFMAHGKYDTVIPLFLAEQSKNYIVSLGFLVDWQVYEMEHGVCGEEIAQIAKFIL